ncbi:MAG: S-layer homology domain-containing protein [Clostridiales Family XIII bacterium]|nr:S-layer homology domain-containing protein [Clostridiales Family XIII bacterium]
MKELIAQAKTGGKADITVTVTKTGDAGRIEACLLIGSVNDIVKSGLTLTVKTAAATIRLDGKTLSGITNGAADSETVRIAAEIVSGGNEPVFDLSVTAGETAVRSFGGTVTVTLPYTAPADADPDLLTVYYRGEDGSAAEMKDAKYDAAAKTIRFTTDHFSRFFISEWISPFGDIAKGDWYYKNVRYAYAGGLMGGTAADTFAPDAKLSRAMLVTILWRQEGSPEARGAAFSDVKPGQWYTGAAAWAGANGIAAGYGDGSFGVNDDITREQLATLLYNYAKWKNPNTAGGANLAGFSDADGISSWALDAMQWANTNGLVTGRTATALVPGGDANRAEAAAILQRFLENTAKA